MVRIEFLVAVTSASMVALEAVHREIRAILPGHASDECFFQRVTLQVAGSRRGNTSRLEAIAESEGSIGKGVSRVQAG